MFHGAIQKLHAKTFFVALVISLFLIKGGALAGKLLVYSSTDADNLKYYMEQFQKDNPDIKVNVVRESTGTMAAKMMAEKDNPQADFLFEMAQTLDKENALMMLGAGDGGKDPLILNDGGKPYRAFLEGRIQEKKYCLILHLTDQELKPLPNI